MAYQGEPMKEQKLDSNFGSKLLADAAYGGESELSELIRRFYRHRTVRDQASCPYSIL